MLAARGGFVGFISLAVSCDFFGLACRFVGRCFQIWTATIDFLLIHQDGSGPEVLGKHGRVMRVADR